MPIRVSSIQRGCVYDGPGVRTTVFLKGCYLTCPWCCNPEAMHYDGDLCFFHNLEKCGKSILCNNCEVKKGIDSKLVCPFGVYEPTYADWDASELYNEIIKDYNLFIESSGGITFSGGEPLLQATDLLPVLRLLKDNGFSVAIESSLYAPSLMFKSIIDFVDNWLIDVKFQSGYVLYQNSYHLLDDFFSNLQELQKNNKSIEYRMVITHQTVSNISRAIDCFKSNSINSVNLLIYHNLGSVKYSKLGIAEKKFTPPSDEEIVTIRRMFEKNNIITKVLSI